MLASVTMTIVASGATSEMVSVMSTRAGTSGRPARPIAKATA
jgi:hypothetical protein